MFGGLEIKAWLRLVAAAAVLLLIFGAYVKGCSDEKARFDAYKALASAAAADQEKRTAARVEADRKEKERIENDHKARLARLAARAQRDRERMLDLASRSVVPAVSDAAGSGDDPVACFDRGLLNAELAGVLQRHAERLSAIAGEGEGVAAAFSACAGWAVNEATK